MDQMLFIPQWGKILVTDRHAMLQDIAISESGQARVTTEITPCRKAFSINFIKWHTNKHGSIHKCYFVSMDYLTWQ